MKLSTLGWGLYWWSGSAGRKIPASVRRWHGGINAEGVDLDSFVSEYITAMLFTELPDGHPDSSSSEFSGSYADRKWSKRITKASRAVIERECLLFCASAGDLISDDPLRAARDFWYNRNGHGSGFLDGDWSHVPATIPQFGDAGIQLASLAKCFGEVCVEFWRGWVHHRDVCCLTQLP